MFDYRFEDAGQKGIFHQNERDGMAATAADYYYSSRDSASIRDNAAIIITRWIIRSSRNIHSHPLISGGTNSIFEEGSFLVFVDRLFYATLRGNRQPVKIRRIQGWWRCGVIKPAALLEGEGGGFKEEESKLHHTVAFRRFFVSSLCIFRTNLIRVFYNLDLTWDEDARISRWSRISGEKFWGSSSNGRAC